MIQWDASAIFEQIGGPAALRRALTEDYDRAPAEATVAMWKSRNRIAAEWIAACIFAVIRRRAIPLANLLEELTTDVPDDPF
jgi:hypothetical protein